MYPSTPKITCIGSDGKFRASNSRTFHISTRFCSNPSLQPAAGVPLAAAVRIAVILTGGGAADAEAPNPKIQTPGNLQPSNFKARLRVDGYWNLGFLWNLEIGIWRFYLLHH